MHIQPSDFCVVITTADSKELAETLASTLVREKLAACAQIFPITSTYWWNGQVESTPEFQIHLKTTKAAAPRNIQRITEIHPYEVPEIISLPITQANPTYLHWIQTSTTP